MKQDKSNLYNKKKILALVSAGLSILPAGSVMAASTTLGDGAVASGTESVAIGQSASAETKKDTDATLAGDFGTAVGAKATSSAEYTAALGYSAQATALDATALGAQSVASAKNATALGQATTATGANSTALGTSAEATANSSTAIGVDASATNEYTTAIGDNSTVSSFSSIGIGSDIKVSGDDSVGIGVSAKITGTENTGIGFKAQTAGGYATAIGAEAKATEEGATAIGNASKSTAVDTTAIGYKANASAYSATAIGKQATASAQDSIALGRQTSATGAFGVAIGTKSVSAGKNALAMGEASQANKDNSVAIGSKSAANGENAFALGEASAAGADNAVSIGSKSSATGENAFAMGESSVAGADNTIAIGSASQATAENALAIGEASKALVGSAIALGSAANAGTLDSISIGESSSVTGARSIALGGESSATGANAVAIGTDSVADENNSVSVGSSTQTRKITNVTAGVNDTDAVNVSQLKSGLATKANLSLDNISDGGKTVIKNLAKEVDTNSTVTNSDGNLTVSPSTNGNTTSYTVNLADNITADSYAAGDKVFVSATGLNANGLKVTNVANGTVAKNSADAVNGGQLYDVDSAIRTTITNNVTTINENLDNKANKNLDNLTEDGKTVVKNLAKEVDTNSTVKNTDGNLTVSNTTSGNTTEYTVNLASNVKADTFGVSDKVFISASGLNANSMKVANVADGEVSSTSKDAVNGSQLNTVIKAVEVNKLNLDGKANTSLNNITEDGETVIKDLAKSVDTTATVDNTDGNLVVVATEDGSTTGYTVNLAKSIKADSYAVGDKIYVSADGLNANSNKVTNVANGSVAAGSMDAVNGGQLQEVITSVNTNVENINKALDGKANTSLDNITEDGETVVKNLAKEVDTNSKVMNTDGNLVVTSSADGNTTTYTVNLTPNIIAESFGVGDKVYISASGINANNQKVTNVADGKTDKDAVNLGQLNAAITAAINGSVNPNIVEYDSSAKDKVTFKGENGTTLSNVKAGTLSSTSTEAVNGSQLYTTDQNVAKNTADIANLRTDVNTNTTDIANIKTDVSSIKTDVKNNTTEINNLKSDMTTVKSDITNIKSDVAQNTEDIKNTKTDVAQNASDIKNVKADVTNIKSEITDIKADITTIEGDVAKNKSDIADLQEADKMNVKYSSAKKDAIHLAGANGTTIKNLADAKADDEAVNLGQMNKALENVNANVKNVVKYDGDNHQTITFDGKNGTTLTGVANGKVEAGSKDAVNGGQLYDEKAARENADKELNNKIGSLGGGDYNVIKAGNDVSKNLEALDKAIVNIGTGDSLVIDNGNEITIAKNSTTNVIDVSGKGGNRVITGVATDANDGSSAANVDFVNSQNKKIEKYADGIGAQAAAMASLHPLEYEKDDKVSVSASVGSYKSQVAGAIGAFYRPDRKSMISIQGSFGANDNMLGIGFSKKFHKGNDADEDMHGEDAVALRNEVSTLQKKNNELEDKYSQLEKKLEQQNAMIIKLLGENSGLAPETVAAMFGK